MNTATETTPTPGPSPDPFPDLLTLPPVNEEVGSKLEVLRELGMLSVWLVPTDPWLDPPHPKRAGAGCCAQWGVVVVPDDGSPLSPEELCTSLDWLARYRRHDAAGTLDTMRLEIGQ